MHKQKGFTIVELLIVIVVIGILAAITIVAFTGVQARARDSQRKSDLAAIAKAVAIRGVENSTALHYGTACASGNSGFFNQTGTSETGSNYGTQSAMDCLRTEANITSTFRDPTGRTSCPNGTGATCYIYMFASCSGATYIYAHLETLPLDSTATDGTCQSAYDSSYGMNYYVRAL